VRVVVKGVVEELPHIVIDGASRGVKANWRGRRDGDGADGDVAGHRRQHPPTAPRDSTRRNDSPPPPPPRRGGPPARPRRAARRRRRAAGVAALERRRRPWRPRHDPVHGPPHWRPTTTSNLKEYTIRRTACAA